MSHPRIHRLSSVVSSQIAAGEVVERPFNAVKELIENALDADATRCEVEITGGGITRILVRDDGGGMTAEEAELALERHATSKLSTVEELNTVASYGFRGEALPSIASVSRFRLATRRADSDEGVEVSTEGGETIDVRPAGLAVGTEVEIRDLFFNVPARRKFLRSTGTESGHITEVVEGAALARPEVTFLLTRDGRVVRRWLRSADREERVRAMYPDEELARCAGERGPMRVEAYLSRPERARQGAGGLKVMVNGRPVQDRAITTTVAQAYGSVIERGRYPRGVVYIDLPSRWLDVNVHPRKSQVRFSDPRAVTDAVYRIISIALAQAFSLPAPNRGAWARRPPADPIGKFASDARPPPATARGADGPALPDRYLAPGAVAAAATSPYPPTPTPLTGTPAVSLDGAPRAPHAPHAPHEGAALQVQDVHAGANARERSELGPLFSALGVGAELDGAPVFGAVSDAAEGVPGDVPGNVPEALRPSPTTSWGSLSFVAQARGTFLICEGEDGLYVLDQHAAAERVNFDRLRKQYQSRAVSSQALLFPVTVDSSAEEAELVEAQQDELVALGFDLRRRGPESISIHSVPRLLQRSSPERIVRDLFAELTRAGGRGFSDAVDLALATMACHGSIRAGDGVSSTEAAALLDALDRADFAGHCPHGRPVVMRIAWAELERQVGRR